jgi:aspartyl-tRNA(Asn)/glutamyl-tRNA(Gln) amidotransferase subunit A
MTGGLDQDRARAASARPHEDGTLTWLPAWRIRELVATGDVSAVEVTEHFLGRIEELDPVLHAFRAVDVAGARAQARRADAAVRAGDDLGPVHGVPVAVKEHLAVEGVPSHDLLTSDRSPAPRDAVEVERVRAAGAVVVGSTVAGVTALEFGDSDRQPSNPWDARRVPGDSSGGSACAVAAALTPVALGVDGRGSTRLPAAFCGLVGLHPTRGRVPSFHWGEVNPRPLSTTGPLARDVRDAAVILGVLAGPDGRDLVCLQDDPPDYTAALEGGAEGVRLVWTDDFGYAAAYAGPQAAEVVATVRHAAMGLRDVGATVEVTSQAWPDPDSATAVVLAADRCIASRRQPPPEDVAAARKVRQRVWETFRTVIGPNDLLLSPTVQYPAPTREEWARNWSDLRYMATYTAHTSAANLLGWPAVSVPAGFVDGMPVGLQIMARPDREQLVLQVAQAFLAARDREVAEVAATPPG